MSDVQPREVVEMDSVRRRQAMSESSAFNIVMMFQEAYEAGREVREQGERCLRYYLGRGWSDTIQVGRRTMTEEAYIKSQGKVPLQQNLLRTLGRRVVGVYREGDKEPMCVARDKKELALGTTMSELLSYNWKLNKSKNMYARTVDYYLNYGLVAHRHWAGWKDGKFDCWNERLSVSRLIWDPHAEKDNMADARLIGYLHDMPIGKVYSTFAHSPQDYQRLAEVYRWGSRMDVVQDMYAMRGKRLDGSRDFFMPDEVGMCRVIEMWTLEEKPRYHCHDWMTGDNFVIEEGDYKEQVEDVNAARVALYRQKGSEAEAPLIDAEWSIDEYWYYRFVSPTGVVLAEGETPYRHGRHPIVVKAYPMIEGKIHSFNADLLDLQRMVNRLVTKYNWIIDASAKGSLLMDVNSESDKMPVEEIGKHWARIGDVVLWDSSRGGVRPQQMSANNTNVGIMDMLNVQLRFIEDVSSVTSAVQGKAAYSGMSGTLYQQQTQNGLRGLSDIIESFNEFVCENAEMDVKNIQQFYDMNKVLNIVGEEGEDVTAKAERAMNIDYDLSVVQSTTSPTYADRVNEPLLMLLEKGFIGLRELLKVGKFDFSEKLLQEIDAQQQRAQQGEPVEFSAEARAELQHGSNPQTVERIYNAMRQSA